jgi:hypothetical protein
MTSNNFCRHLSNGYRINIQGDKITWMPCCQWTGDPFPFVDLATQRKKINIHTPWVHKECNRCQKEEKYKLQSSYRIVGNRSILDDLPDNKVGWLDIQADMTCNGGCLICGPWNSSFWQNELVRYEEYKKILPRQDFRDSIDLIFNKLDVSDLSLLQFLGGEPFLSNIDELSFQYIPNPNICKLKYTTNGSIWPSQNRWQEWERFREISINFSIDGIGKRFDYLRYPLKWEIVSKNVERFIKQAPPNMTFHINHTVTPFNIYYYQEFIDWVESVFPYDKFKGIHVHPAYGVMSVSSISDNLRKIIKSKYGATHNLSVMIDQNPTMDHRSFWNYIGIWDKRRGTDWKKIFPEIVDLL